MSVFIKLPPIILLSILSNLICFAQTPQRGTNYSYKIPRQCDDGIAVASLADAGVDSNKIIRLTKLILADTFTNIHSLLIVRNNKLVYENYFSGKDEIWGLKLGYAKHDINALHDIRSISKTIVSACIGIAVMQKKIKSIDDPIFNYLPDYIKYKTEFNDKITIRNLLTMSSGIEWDEDSPHNTKKNDESQMEKTDDPVAYALNLPMAQNPGTVWNYNSGGVQILAAIIRNVSGVNIDQFAATYLFYPLGIKDYQWTNIRKNFPAAASGLRLRSRDLLKIGLLYVNNGKYNNLQLIPEWWVKESLSPQILRNGVTKTRGYGYLFWTQTDSVNQKPYTIVSARGNGGERMFIDEQEKLVVVITAGNYNIADIVNDGQMALIKYILPALN